MADAFHIGFDQPDLGGVLPVPDHPFEAAPPTAPEQANPSDADWSHFPEARTTSKGPDGAEPPKPLSDLGSQIDDPYGFSKAAPAPAAPPETAPPATPAAPLTGDQQMQEWLHPTTPQGKAQAQDLDAVTSSFHAAWENDTLFGGLQNATSDAIRNIVDGAKSKLGVTLEDPTHGGYEDEAIQRVIAQRSAQSWGSYFNPLDPEGFFGGGAGFKAAVQKAQMDIFDEKRQALADKIKGDTAFENEGRNSDALALIDPETPGAALGAKLSHEANVAAGQAVDAAGGRLSARIGSLVGGLAGGVRDPVNDLSMMVGGGIEPYLAKTYFPLAPAAVRIASNITEGGVQQALINMGLTAIGEPERQSANLQRGEESGLQPALHDIEDAGIAGFVPGAFIHGVKALSELHGPDSKPWIDEFIRQAKGADPDPVISPASRSFMDAVHEWERSKGLPEGSTYAAVDERLAALRAERSGKPPPEPPAAGARAAPEPPPESPGGAPRLLGGPDFPKSPDLPASARNRPSASSIAPEDVRSAEADAGAMPPALPGTPPSEHLRVYTEAVRHGEAPDVMAPPEPPMSAPPAADANFLPPDHHPGVPERPAAQEFEHGGKPVTAGVSFPARELRTDAATYQYKAGGDTNGVTDRLQTVRQWSPLSVGNIVAHERLDGQRYIVDGHQRLGLANRIMDANPGQNISLPGFLFKEADGWTPEDVRAEAAAKNIREGLGDTLDIARILRDKPEMWDDSLPIGRGDMKEARGLANLSDEAWGMAINGKPRRDFASFVGNMASDPSTHLAIMDDLVKFEPRTQNEARMIIADAMQAGFNKTSQEDLFGTHEVTESLRGERSKVYAAAERLLRDDKKIFGMLNDEAPRIIAAGNVLADTNAERADRAGQLAQGLITLAQRAGPVSASLNRAAQRVADGEAPKTAARAFLNELPALLKDEGLRVADIAGPPKYDFDKPQGREEQVRDLEAEFTATQPGMFSEPLPHVAYLEQQIAEIRKSYDAAHNNIAKWKAIAEGRGIDPETGAPIDSYTVANVKQNLSKLIAEETAARDEFARQLMPLQERLQKLQGVDAEGDDVTGERPANESGPASDIEAVVREIAHEVNVAAKASPDPLDRKIGEILEREVAPLIDEAFPPPATEAGPEGTRQTLMPGVEPVTDAARAQVGAAAPLRGGNAAPPAGGLFDDLARAQNDLFAMTPTEDGLKTREQMQNEVPRETALSKFVSDCQV